MARLARVVIPGVLHHIAQRGNRRRHTFFHGEDYAAVYADVRRKLEELCRLLPVEMIMLG